MGRGHAIQPPGLPSIGQLKPGAWCLTGFGGLGMALTTVAGHLVAGGIAGEDGDGRRFERVGLPFAAGRLGRAPAHVIHRRHAAASRSPAGRDHAGIA